MLTAGLARCSGQGLSEVEGGARLVLTVGLA